MEQFQQPSLVKRLRKENIHKKQLILLLSSNKKVKRVEKEREMK